MIFMIDAIAIFVSVLAMVVSYMICLSQNKIVKQGVQPFVSIDKVDIGSRVAINILNDGVGVAIISEITYWYDGKKQNGKSLVEIIEENCNEGSLLADRAIWKRFEYVKAIGPGQKKVLLELEDTRYLDDLRKILDKVSMEINYESIYGDIFSLKDDMDYFGRSIK